MRRTHTQQQASPSKAAERPRRSGAPGGGFGGPRLSVLAGPGLDSPWRSLGLLGGKHFLASPSCLLQPPLVSSIKVCLELSRRASVPVLQLRLISDGGPQKGECASFLGPGKGHKRTSHCCLGIVAPLAAAQTVLHPRGASSLSESCWKTQDKHPERKRAEISCITVVVIFK